MENKIDLRTKFKKIRTQLDISNISNKIADNIILSDIYQSANNVMIFYPLEYEINLLKLTEDNTKNFYLPRINKNNIECCPYKQNDTLKKGPFNIYEPQTECLIQPNLDIIIVPALVVDTEGNRIGYGGGFYDRFLKGFTSDSIKPLKLTVTPEKCLLNSVPNEEFDIKMDYIVTEKQIYNIIQG